jgi:hypothetical protein
LKLVRDMALPPDLFDGVLPHELERYRRRVPTEASYELRRHPEAVRLVALAVYAYLRGPGAALEQPDGIVREVGIQGGAFLIP